MKIRYTIFFLLIISFFCFSCGDKYNWNNPLDSNNKLSPEEWAPKSLQLQKLNDTQIKLMWGQEDKRIEGFYVERQMNKEPWQRLVQLERQVREYTDSGLDNPNRYTYRICAFTSEWQSSFIFGILPLIDIDGNNYKEVKIGEQWWMAENLRVTHFNNGDPISNVTDKTAWSSLTTSAYCSWGNDDENVTNHGLLYNWYAIIDSRNIAPEGWHVPTVADWQILFAYVGSNAGKKLKSTQGWFDDGNGTDTYALSVLPSGYRDTFGTFFYLRSWGCYWSSTESNSEEADCWVFTYDDHAAYRNTFYKDDGLSVRFVRD